jgi:radical SAM superfamily enzyme YgiQ (UPF0313 family)
MKILLLSTYELGRQPFGIASPAAWLRERGHAVVCTDLSRETLSEQAVRDAGLIGLYVPMHTATRLALELLPTLRRLNPTAHFCAFGLYAATSCEIFHANGIISLFSGEFEQSLVDLADQLSHPTPTSLKQDATAASDISLARLRFKVPDRRGLPPLKSYAHLVLPNGEHRTVGYTEASRGCKHHCRHCPVVPVYNGAFRLVDPEIVLADIRQQVSAGAQHITFGDPDFFNAVRHAVPIIESLHREFPQVTYDATIKVEHLRKHADLLPTLRETSCLFVVSAVESLDDAVLARLEKHHTREEFFQVVELFRRERLTLQPTFVSFTPWTTLDSYLDLLTQLRRLDLVESVAPVQLTIRLLIPAGSRLLELSEVRQIVGDFDPQSLVYPWSNPDPRVDKLATDLQAIVTASEKAKLSRSETFSRIWRAANLAADRRIEFNAMPLIAARATVPYLNEPWYC